MSTHAATHGVEPSIEASPGCVEEALGRCGLAREDFAKQEVMLRAGTLTRWPDDPGAWAHSSVEMQTSHVDVYRRWMMSAQHWGMQPAGELPSPEAERYAGVLDAQAHEELATVARCFVFGNCARLLGYQALMEKHFGPFNAHAVLIHKLVLGKGATLLLRQAPFVLMVDSLVMQRGSRLLVEHLSHVTVGELRRV